MSLACSESDRLVCQAVFGERLGLVEEYARMLSEQGIEWGLLGPREADRIWDRHIVNCVYVVGLIQDGAWVADLGSGAGLPGVVVALARPGCRVDLVEPMLRRVQFLQMCVERLDLSGRVRVVRASAQEYANGLRVKGRGGCGVGGSRNGRSECGRSGSGGSGGLRSGGSGSSGSGSDQSMFGGSGSGGSGMPEVVTCRAVKSVSGLVGLVKGLVPPAELLCIKGEKAEAEVAQARDVLQANGLTAKVLRLRHEQKRDEVGTVVRIGGR